MDLSAFMPIISLIVAGVISVVGGFAVRWLNARTKLDAHADDATTWHQLSSVVFSVAAAVAARSFPKLASLVREGKFTSKDDVKRALYELGEIAFDEVKTIAPDLVAKHGKPAVMALIRSAADKLNPYPGQETAAAILVNPDAALTVPTAQ